MSHPQALAIGSSDPAAAPLARPAAGDLGRFAWAATAAFGAYFCVYGLRMPFKAATFADVPPPFAHAPGFLGRMSFKAVLVTAQVIGYCLSKFAGIGVVAAVPPARRAAALLALGVLAEGALLGLPAVPPAWAAVPLLANGLALGMAFGLVLGFLEGRRQSEAMIAGLCGSFIAADGITKGAGAAVVRAGVGQMWMPAVTGGLFLVPLAAFAWALTRIPHPDAADVLARSHRPPMDRRARRAFLRRYWPGLSLLGGGYVLVTVVRSLRGDFATEIWQGLGVTAKPSTFAASETLVAVAALAAFAGLVFVRDNRRAFVAAVGMAVGGFGVGLAALAGRGAGVVGPFPFVVLVGVGLYLPYIAVHTTLFERLLALTRERANIAFLMYLVDAVGYLGYVVLMVCEGSLKGPTVVPLFTRAAWATMAAGAVAFAAAGVLFVRHPAARSRSHHGIS